MSGSQQESASSSAQAGKSRQGAGSAAALVVGGVLLTGLVAGAAFYGRPAGPPGASEVVTVAAAELGGAGPTLDPAKAAALTEEAKACRAPLAMVTLSKAPGAPDSTVRIRSGAYLSPSFHVGAAPIRVALPFPAPYPAGIGQFIVEGQQEGLNVTLYPTLTTGITQGAGALNVWWRTDKPCGG